MRSRLPSPEQGEGAEGKRGGWGCVVYFILPDFKVQLISMNLGKRIWAIYAGGFLLAVHYASVAYVNSSLLKQFVGDREISALFITGSILSILSLLLAPLLLRKVGNIAVLTLFATLEVIAVFGMGSFNLAYIIFIAFLLHQGAESILYLSLDLSLESETKKERATGGHRGAFLTIQNIAWVISPLALSLLVKNNDFSNAYYLSGLALLPLIVIAILFFKNTKKSVKSDANIIDTIKYLKKEPDKVKIIGAQFSLQFYFAWMLVYLPLMLASEIGFGWDKIGIILMIMLVPYLLFELPAGLLGDHKFGEKEILTTGFIIMAVSTAIIPFIRLPMFGVWASILFVTRIGASLVEISSESYFFKHVKEDDTGLISIFRMARPFSLIVAPIVAFPIVSLFSYSKSFFFLAGFILLGIFFVPKVDTR